MDFLSQAQLPSVPRPRTVRPRPESALVQSFADDLDSMFGLSPEVEELEDTINAKKQTVSSGERELRDLEARLRETEKRLARASRSGAPAGYAYKPTAAELARDEAEDNHNSQLSKAEVLRQTEQRMTSPLAQTPSYPADRPLTGKRQEHRHAVLPTRPHEPASEYVMVGRQ